MANKFQQSVLQRLEQEAKQKKAPEKAVAAEATPVTRSEEAPKKKAPRKTTAKNPSVDEAASTEIVSNTTPKVAKTEKEVPIAEDHSP